jgi:hypothetical protein
VPERHNLQYEKLHSSFLSNHKPSNRRNIVTTHKSLPGTASSGDGVDTLRKGSTAVTEPMSVASTVEDLGCLVQVLPIPVMVAGERAELAAEESEARCYKRLDEALYRAKAEGRNRVCVAEPDSFSDSPPDKSR